jgi:tetratricopeptide (TPR) repeat protein
MRNFFNVILATVLLVNVTIAQVDLTTGIKHIANENYGDATKFFEKVMTADPKNGAPLYYLGKIKYALEDYTGASDLFNKGALLDKKCFLCQVGQGQILLDNGKSAEADKLLMGVAKSFKKSAPAIAAIGDAYLYSKKSNGTKAIEYLTKSRDLDPKVGSTWAHLGDAYLALPTKEHGNAMSSYEVAVQKDKTNVEAFVSMGKIWRDSKNYDDAVKNLEEALKLDPSYAPAYKELISTYMRMDRYTKVTPLLEKYVPLAGNDEQAKVRLVKFLCFEAKDYDRAILLGEEYKETIKDYTLNRWLGWSYVEKEKYEEGYTAMKQFLADVNAEPAKRKAVMIDFDYLARAAAKTNRMDEALAAYDKVFQQDPTKAVDVYSNLAKTYYEGKNYEKAVEYYNKRAALKALNNQDLYRLAQAYMQVKNYVEAEKTLRQYTAQDATFVPAFYTLARSVANQDPDRVTWAAIPDYQKYLEIANAQADKSKFLKNMVDAYMYVGVGLVQKGDMIGAKAAFDNVLILDPAHEEAKKNSDILSKGGK